MKSRIFNRKRVTATGIIALLGMAVPAFAWMGHGSGYGMGYGGGTAVSGSTLDAEQQKQMAAVHDKYQPQIQKLQQELDAGTSEMAAARVGETTTAARLNSLQAELSQLERRYWTLLDRANADAARVTGASYGPYFTCGYLGCNHQYHMGPQMDGRYDSYPRYSNQYSGCCW